MSEMGYPAVRARFGRPQRSSSSSGMPLHTLDALREAPSSLSVVDEQQPLRDSSHRHRSPYQGPMSPGSRAPIPHPRNGSSGDYDGRAGGRAEEDKPEDEERQPLSPPPGWAPGPPRQDQGQGQGRTQRPQTRPQWKPQRQQRP